MTKPYYPHKSGYWAAEIGGKTVCLGRWSTPLTEVDRAFEEQVSLAPSRTPGDASNSNKNLTVKRLANLYLAARQADVESAEQVSVE